MILLLLFPYASTKVYGIAAQAHAIILTLRGVRHSIVRAHGLIMKKKIRNKPTPLRQQYTILNVRFEIFIFLSANIALVE